MDSEESDEWEETEYESLDWGDSENEPETSIVSLYPSTNKPNVAALLLIIAGFRVALFWPSLAGNAGKLLTWILWDNSYLHFCQA